MELLQLLQNESVEGAQEILSKIRTGAAVEDILAESSAQIQGVVSPQALEKITIPGAAISGDALAFMHENPLSPTLVSAIKSCLPGIHAWREAVSFMLQVTGIVFPALSQARIQQLLNAAHQEQTQSRAGLDEICALAAASSQYSRGGISETVGTIMYSVAKLYLDDVIQVDRIAAVRVCIFLVLYNAVHRADVAFADTGEFSARMLLRLLIASRIWPCHKSWGPSKVGHSTPRSQTRVWDSCSNPVDLQKVSTLNSYVLLTLTLCSWLAAALGYVVADEHLTNWTGVVDGVDGVPGLAGV